MSLESPKLRKTYKVGHLSNFVSLCIEFAQNDADRGARKDQSAVTESLFYTRRVQCK
jgi:hypothetical protein